MRGLSDFRCLHEKGEFAHPLIRKSLNMSKVQLQQSTMIVLVATLVITGIVWVMDFGSNNLLKLVYSLFK